MHIKIYVNQLIYKAYPSIYAFKHLNLIYWRYLNGKNTELKNTQNTDTFVHFVPDFLCPPPPMRQKYVHKFRLSNLIVAELTTAKGEDLLAKLQMHEFNLAEPFSPDYHPTH